MQANIASLVQPQSLITHGMELVFEQEKKTPCSISYSIQRYKQPQQLSMEDNALLYYNYEPKQLKNNYIELRFCTSGNMYCPNPDCANGICKKRSEECKKPIATFDMIFVKYSYSYLNQFAKGSSIESNIDQLLHFKQKDPLYTVLNLCPRTRLVLESIIDNDYNGIAHNIFISSQLQSLFLLGLDCVVDEKKEAVFECKFLANDADREKIMLAKKILIQRINEPITIKELSRMVGTNECYLKKGFKELFGATVFDFYQAQRMEHARYLLYDKGLSVTDVSNILGYSSISHFSTAFKKYTGLKPCELLFR